VTLYFVVLLTRLRNYINMQNGMLQIIIFIRPGSQPSRTEDHIHTRLWTRGLRVYKLGQFIEI
jgi:hypothetical protein